MAVETRNEAQTSRIALAQHGLDLRGRLLQAVPIRPSTEDIARSNLELLSFLLRQNTNPEIAETRVKFERIYERLLEATQAIAEESRSFLLSIGHEPGEIRFYMIGGRTHFEIDEQGRMKAQPLKTTSDIDAGVAIEKLPSLGKDPIRRGALESELMDHLVGSGHFIRDLCKQLGIANEFHLIAGTHGFPVKINTPGGSLLLASAK